MGDSGQRRGADRRRPPTLWDRRSWGFGGRRRGVGRRVGDGARPFVDWYPPRLLYFSLATLLLSALDAHLTLWLLRNGAVEANAVMAALMERSISAFVYTKILLTAGSLIVLVIHSRFTVFRVVKVERIFLAAFGIYLGLIVYEVVLIGLIA